MRLKRTTSLAAAALTMCSVILISSCGGGNGQTSNTSDTTTAESSQITTAADPLASFPSTKFSGATFTILTRETDTAYWNVKDIYAEQEIGEAFNDAVFKRNSLVNERLDVNIKGIPVNDSTVVQDIDKVVKAGTDDYQLVADDLFFLAPMAVTGTFLDFASLPTVDLTVPCWNSFVNDALTVAHKQFFAVGDLNIRFNDSSWIIMFNKSLAQDLGFGNQYQDVLDGNWTLDMLHANCKTATKDLNGDGMMDETDQWGACNEYSIFQALYAAAGQRSFTKDASTDLPVCVMDASSNQIEIMQSIYDFITDNNAQIKSEDYVKKYPKDPWTPVNVKIFSDGRSLYYLCSTMSVGTMRGMNDDFGLIPLPKYDTEQSEYYDTISYRNPEVIATLASVKDTQMTGAVIQAMCLASTSTTRPAYYDVLLKGKYVRDDESVAMLDIIFKNMILDIGLAFNWGGCSDMYMSVAQAKTFKYASIYQQIRTKIDTNMQAAIVEFTD